MPATAKKTATKSAKKAAPRKTASRKSAASARRAVKTYEPTAKITVVAEFENPKKAGSAKHAMYELVKKASGKTVEKFLEAGGRLWALSGAERRKLAKVG